MRVFTTFSPLLYIFLIWGCTNLDDAPISKRNSFIHLYEGPRSYISADIIEVADGYIILGNTTDVDDSLVTVIIKTDKFGNTIGQHSHIPGGIGKSIIPFSNLSFTGYLIIGDRIKVDGSIEPAGNIEVDAMRLLGINENLEFEGSATLRDPRAVVKDGPVLTDFKGSAITLTDNGEPILLCTYKPAGEQERPLILVLEKEFTFDPVSPYKLVKPSDVNWDGEYTVIDKDYVNGKSLHFYNNKIIWASSILKQSGNFNDTYGAIPTVQDSLAFVNYSMIGNNIITEQLFSVNDIQPANSVAFGFGIIGTYGETDGTKKNMFFAPVDKDGNIQTQEAIFIDAFDGITSQSVSTVDETGDAICSTNDGGFLLAGTLTTTAVGTKTFGNGEGDIFLVKINAFGDIVWKKIIGGAGDEVVSRVRQDSDGNIIITGTNTIGEYSSIFFLKTDSNGELKK